MFICLYKCIYTHMYICIYSLLPPIAYWAEHLLWPAPLSFESATSDHHHKSGHTPANCTNLRLCNPELKQSAIGNREHIYIYICIYIT